jgi:regulator of RNase E activity RraA
MDKEFIAISPTVLADILNREQVMGISIQSIWHPVPRIAGPAYTVRCCGMDNTMVHAAIYRADPGDVIVVETGGCDFAVAGGNVCAVAKKRGIAGFVIDGVIRDLSEICQDQFPVFAKGIYPKPGIKGGEGAMGTSIKCGGVHVSKGDIVVADEEGIVVVPKHLKVDILEKVRAAKDADLSLEAWQRKHMVFIERLLIRGKAESTETEPNV